MENETLGTERHGCDEVTNESTPLSIPHSTEMPWSSAMARRPQFQSSRVAREAHLIKDLSYHLN